MTLIWRILLFTSPIWLVIECSFIANFNYRPIPSVAPESMEFLSHTSICTLDQFLCPTETYEAKVVYDPQVEWSGHLSRTFGSRVPKKYLDVEIAN